MARNHLLIGVCVSSLAVGCQSDFALGESDQGTGSTAGSEHSITSPSSSTGESPVTDGSISGTETSGESNGKTSSGSSSSEVSATTTNMSSSSTSLTGSATGDSTVATASSDTDASSTGGADTRGANTGGADTGGATTCGDGVVAGGEDCDDGNVVSFDGCSSGCVAEGPIVQICAGTARTCVVDGQGRLKCWGANLYGELGIGGMEHVGDDPGEMGADLPFVDVGMKVDAIACRQNFCALGTEGQVKCWGGPTGPYLGLGTTEAIGDDPGEMGDALATVELGEPALQIANAPRGACAFLASGALKCWGFNESGQLGVGDTQVKGDEPGEMGLDLPAVNLGQLKPVQIVRGHHQNCAFDAGGNIKCWGKGQLLGLESAENRGDQPGEMGNMLPFIDLGAGAKVAQASATSGHVCVVLVDGRLKCWGEDNGSNVLWPFGSQMVWYGWEPGQMGDNLPAYDLGEHNAVAVEAGDGSSCVLLDDQSVKCWGYAGQGIMGTGSPAPWLGDPLDKVPAIDLGAGEVVTQVSHGYYHACALLASGRVKCWGANLAGELGYEDDNNRGDEPGEMGDALPFVEVF